MCCGFGGCWLWCWLVVEVWACWCGLVWWLRFVGVWVWVVGWVGLWFVVFDFCGGRGCRGVGEVRCVWGCVGGGVGWCGCFGGGVGCGCGVWFGGVWGCWGWVGVGGVGCGCGGGCGCCGVRW
ncbi:hypothetical protein, partial [Pseudomonas syringae group genomosp. 7]|uniref:hypothetical protein n=1 Tax=Pseudomonas syringae group genomosp. 7 TaxID=251699 RepID=UPI003770214B